MERQSATGYSEASSDESIPLVQETLRVGKRDTSHGRVRIRAYMVETPVSETVELRDEHVELVQTPVDRPAIVDEDYRERTFEAEEHREEAVVSKEARVVEEIGLRKTSDTRQETVSDTVRHTEVEVDDERSTLGHDDRGRTRE
nr:YsnF/AvaK domain-containing protein [Paracoccus sp. NBH48]